MQRNISMELGINPFVVFSVGALPFTLPSAWVTSEKRSVYNAVQQTDNPRWVPPISLTNNNLSIMLNVPVLLKNKVAAISIKILKASLMRHAELWASEKYQDVDLDTHRPTQTWQTSDSTGASITTEFTPNPAVGHYTPFGNIKLPWYLPLITGYIGVDNYMLGGYLESFSCDFDHQSLMDTWTISLQAINLSALRRDAPNPEMSVSDNVEPSSILRVQTSHSGLVNPGAIA